MIKWILTFIRVKEQINPRIPKNDFGHKRFKYEKNIDCFIHVSAHLWSRHPETFEICEILAHMWNRTYRFLPKDCLLESL